MINAKTAELQIKLSVMKQENKISTQKGFAPPALAKQLKESGFLPKMACAYQTQENNRFISFLYHTRDFVIAPHLIPAPSYQQVITWFKEKHGLQLFPDYTYYDGFNYGFKWVKSNGDWGVIWKENGMDIPDGCDTIEEATNLAIEEALKLIS